MLYTSHDCPYFEGCEYQRIVGYGRADIRYGGGLLTLLVRAGKVI
jgi:hypothetical protein